MTEPNEGPATNERATARRGRTGVLEIAETLFLTIAIFLFVHPPRVPSPTAVEVVPSASA